MARSLKPTGKTLSVRSAINIGGLTPGQEAVVDDSESVRNLIKSGFWTLLVDGETLNKVKAPTQVAQDPDPTGETNSEPLFALVGVPTDEGNAFEDVPGDAPES